MLNVEFRHEKRGAAPDQHVEEKRPQPPVCLCAQENLKNKGYGQDLSAVEKEVEEHNIFHSEVEALAPHISAGGDKVGTLSSKKRRFHKNCWF